MTTNEPTSGGPPVLTPPISAAAPGRLSANTLAAGILVWALMSAGFFGLQTLMQNRPEFIGQPAPGPKAALEQDSPSLVMRKVSDDVSVIKAMQPEHSEIRFDMTGRRDYRGLRTIMDMSGEFHARYGLTNALDEAVFVLFKCPHPRTGMPDGGSLPASGLRLQSSVNGAQENAGNAWLWSGTLEGRSGADIDISYQVASITGAAYRVGGENGNPVKQLRVTFHRKDLDSMQFESGDGSRASREATVVWERQDFLAPDFYSGVIVDTRTLYQSLSQLLEIAPGLCLLFLLAVSAVILARQPLNGVQIVTIAVAYAIYFPLILYLSAHLSFAFAVVIAAFVPGALLVNYARWLLGPRLGLLGGMLFLALYWVFPTLAAFAGWNRGMVLLCLVLVTLAVLIDLQNQALRRKAAVAALLALFAWPGTANAGEAPAIAPGEPAPKTAEAKPEIAPALRALRAFRGNSPKPAEAKQPIAPALVTFAPVQYQARQETNYIRVEALASFQILRPGEPFVVLFNAPVYLVQSTVQSAETNLAWIISATNRLWLAPARAGDGTLGLSYRVPIVNHDGKRRAEIPVLAGASGTVRLESVRNDMEILTGSFWDKTAAGKATVYDIGVTAGEALAVEWREQAGEPPPKPVETAAPPKEVAVPPAKPPEPVKDFYGIGLTRAQHLTVINSDGSCTHFAEFEMPAFQAGEFRMKLPAGARLISVSINGGEIPSPAVEDQLCRVQLPGRQPQQTVNRLSFRIAYPPLRLGFIGAADLALPEVFQTAGTTEWVVALPGGFEAQVVSSGLEAQKSQPDLGRFGDYGRILQNHARIFLAKDLSPPGLVGLSLKYRQIVPGLSGPGSQATP
jgi:hypothetical protein